MKPETFASLVSAILYEKRLDLFLIFAMYLSYVYEKKSGGFFISQREHDYLEI